jgi:hypothetical protein
MKIYHGRILTCDSINSTCEYLAEENGVITMQGMNFRIPSKELGR